MGDTKKRKQKRKGYQSPGRNDGGQGHRTVEKKGVEGDPAVERGERIDTGKMIHRGGKTTGHVPGATEHKPQRKEERHAGE